MTLLRPQLVFCSCVARHHSHTPGQKDRPFVILRFSVARTRVTCCSLCDSPWLDAHSKLFLVQRLCVYTCMHSDSAATGVFIRDNKPFTRLRLQMLGFGSWWGRSRPLAFPCVKSHSGPNAELGFSPAQPQTHCCVTLGKSTLLSGPQSFPLSQGELDQMVSKGLSMTTTFKRFRVPQFCFIHCLFFPPLPPPPTLVHPPLRPPPFSPLPPPLILFLPLLLFPFCPLR